MSEDKVRPPVWNEERLEEDRQKSIENFINWRLEKGTEDYVEQYHDSEETVEYLFEATNDLRDLNGEIFEENPDLVEPARFLTGPPVSQDDLDTLTKGSITRRKNIPADRAERGAEVIKEMIDPIRFPWIEEKRSPTEEEKIRAIKWTAGIWAIQKSRTQRRIEPSEEQENRVLEALREKGLVEQKKLSRIDSKKELQKLNPGHFAHNVILKGSECDIPIRLEDGRLLALEGKVSNSFVNSIKRLIHEVGDKASLWNREFGESVIPGAVLGGLFKLKHLEEAQDERKIAIFWDHNLDSLLEFIDKTGRK